MTTVASSAVGWVLIALALGCSGDRGGTAGPNGGDTPGATGAAGNFGAAGATGPSGGSQAFVSVDASACSAESSFRAADCPCGASETASCWTGSPSERGVGHCHDGTQTCMASGEFSKWGPCVGQETNCGVVDASEPCACIPGSTITCDEDCAVSLFCVSDGRKTCQPDGTWSPCREDKDAAPVDINATISGALGVLGSVFGGEGGTLTAGPCRNTGFGCGSIGIGGSNNQGSYTGDCSAVFTCGHAP
jgi:hypothetical protein